MREVSPRLPHCELTHVGRSPIDFALARRQHAGLAREFAELGARVEWLPPLPEDADGVFIEDTAMLLPEVAIIARPGVASRRSETVTVEPALARHRPIERIHDPGTLEGGDVLRIGRTLHVAESRRTNAAGIAQLTAIGRAHGYAVQTVRVQGCLHLKTGVTFIAPNFLVANPAWVDPAVFGRQAVICVEEAEPFAANTLTLGGVTLLSAAHPRTGQRLRAAGIVTRSVEISEFEKAEGGVTCLSLVMEDK